MDPLQLLLLGGGAFALMRARKKVKDTQTSSSAAMRPEPTENGPQSEFEQELFVEPPVELAVVDSYHPETLYHEVSESDASSVEPRVRGALAHVWGLPARARQAARHGLSVARAAQLRDKKGHYQGLANGNYPYSDPFREF